MDSTSFYKRIVLVGCGLGIVLGWDSFMGFAFIAYTSVAYVRILSKYGINLGTVVKWGESKLLTHPLTSFLPMTLIFLSAFAFISLGIGLNSFLMQIKKRNTIKENNLPETTSV